MFVTLQPSSSLVLRGQRIDHSSTPNLAFRITAFSMVGYVNAMAVVLALLAKRSRLSPETTISLAVLLLSMASEALDNSTI